MGLLRTAALRTAPSTVFRSAARPSLPLRKTISQSCLRLGEATSRRSYSSAASPATKKSDLPWAACAVVGTGVGLYIALSPTDPDASHGSHDDHHGKEEHGDVKGENEESADDKSEEVPEDEDKGEAEDSKNEAEESKAESKDEESSEESDSDGEKDDASQLHKGMTKNTGDSKKREADPGKGATKIRIDSGASKTIGEGASSGEGDQFAKAQKGVSNTDTKHSTDPHQDPGKSSKGEGTAETAKVKGTVQLDRPQV